MLKIGGGSEVEVGGLERRSVLLDVHVRVCQACGWWQCRGSLPAASIVFKCCVLLLRGLLWGSAGQVQCAWEQCMVPHAPRTSPGSPGWLAREEAGLHGRPERHGRPGRRGSATIEGLRTKAGTHAVALAAACRWGRRRTV